MRLLTILSLLMLPVSFGQFYSTDSYAYTGNIAPQGSLFNKTLPNRHDSTNYVLDEKVPHPVTSLTKQADSKLAKKAIASPVKPKRAHRTKRKINPQGIKLLSVLYMLKDK